MRFTVSLLSLTVLLAACGSPVAGDGIRVTKILMGSALNEREEIVNEVETFVADATFHAHVFTEGVQQQEQVTAAWWYEDTQKIYETQVVITPEEPVAKLVLMNAKPWPAGAYRLVVTSGDQTLVEKTVHVESAGE